MVLSGIIWTLWWALHLWLIGVVCLALVNDYKASAITFAACHLGIMLTQFLSVGDGFIAPITWAMIYAATGLAYCCLYQTRRLENSIPLARSMFAASLFCLAYYGLQYGKPRNADLVYSFTLGLNVFAGWQGYLLRSGTKKTMKVRA